MQDPQVLHYLRENGRYLAPGGSDDLWLAGAVLLRNWVAVQMVVWSFVTLGFLAIHWLGVLYPMLHGLEWLLWSSRVWASPLIALAAAVLLLAAIPFGMGYFMIGPYGSPGQLNDAPVLNAALALLLPSAALWLAFPGVAAAASSDGFIAYSLLGVVSLSLGMRFAAMSTWRRAWSLPCAGILVGLSKPLLGWFPGSATIAVVVLSMAAAIMWALTSAFERDALGMGDVANHARHNISDWLKVSLMLSAILLGVGLFDTAGRTFYWYLSRAGGHPVAALAGALAMVASTGAAVASFARRVTALLPAARAGDERPGWLPSVLARIGAFVVVSIGLSMAAAFAAAAACSFRGVGVTAADEGFSFASLAGVSLVGLALSFVFAFARVFINRSTHHALYSSRITRAFLGASNVKRRQPPAPARSMPARFPDFAQLKHALPDRSAAALVMPDDDIAPETYWKRGDGRGGTPYTRGAPLHLINVTINETVDGRSRTQQADRKGLGMTLGPAGLTVGARHHAIFHWDSPTPPRFEEPEHKLFVGKPGARFPLERLSVGAWLGISGAAFSTGTGFRTNLGMSVLAGLANIRLGYWWMPGIDRPTTLKRVVGGLFWVQSYLLREFLARFPGTASRLWYLSDGGHFENLGAYELIRRRTRFMLVIDAEADADYEFEGLGNLVRKARTDFGAEIEFLPNTPPRPDPNQPPQALADHLSEPFVNHFGSLDQCRRGTREKALVRRPPPDIIADSDWQLTTPQHRAWSLANASLATVKYSDTGEICWLIYIKPTLTGDEPADLMHYHTTHPSFPHEPTSDQFFDEAQWESYRRLGEHIGARIFSSEADPERRAPRHFFTGDHVVYDPKPAAKPIPSAPSKPSRRPQPVR
jgi:hypothetical protein